MRLAPAGRLPQPHLHEDQRGQRRRRPVHHLLFLQEDRKAFPEAKPRIITDQGLRFKNWEFKSSFIAQ